MTTPKRRKIHRMYSIVLLECGHITDDDDKRKKSTYCFDCLKGKAPDYTHYGITSEQYNGWLKGIK